MKIGIAITGYPGSGKSIAGEKLAYNLNGVNYETGDVVRRGASRHFEQPVEDLSSEELGMYSTMRREKDGGDYVIKDVFENLERNPDFPRDPAIITGMRDSEVPNQCEEFFDRFLIVWIEADFETRLERLQDRGRQDEGGFTEEDLIERDEREDQWGTGDLYNQRDVTILNDSTLPTFYDRLSAVEGLL